ncbi:ParB/RepB/Spo0J family partition protein [Streptomyces sp. NPDC090306]|uniref:ParB/RepB/Spo0J family partition protein n=1 Tax=Streptomyces sp. NPDC090306 TaxID=3365961 RepID=UPI00381BD79F
MSERRRGLGKGLEALIPGSSTGGRAAALGGSTATAPHPGLTTGRSVAAASLGILPPAPREPEEQDRELAGPALAASERAYFAELPIDSIKPNPRQPRSVFDEDALAELITSVKEVGLLQPVVVRQVAGDEFELVMGERRWRACTQAGLKVIPAIVRATEDDKLLLDALLENLHRSQLNPLEEAAAYDQLLTDFNCTHDQLADRIGRSRPQVSNTLRLLKLPPQVQKKVAAGVLSAGHARALLSVDDPEEQERLAKRIVAEGLSVRAVEEIVHLMVPRTKAVQPKGPRPGSRFPALSDLATRLSDRFETVVKVDIGQKKGKITVEFASVEDLDRILSSLAPGEKPVLQQSLLDTDQED